MNKKTILSLIILSSSITAYADIRNNTASCDSTCGASITVASSKNWSASTVSQNCEIGKQDSITQSCSNNPNKSITKYRTISSCSIVDNKVLATYTDWQTTGSCEPVKIGTVKERIYDIETSPSCLNDRIKNDKIYVLYEYTYNLYDDNTKVLSSKQRTNTKQCAYTYDVGPVFNINECTQAIKIDFGNYHLYDNNKRVEGIGSGYYEIINLCS